MNYILQYVLYKVNVQANIFGLFKFTIYYNIYIYI